MVETRSSVESYLDQIDKVVALRSNANRETNKNQKVLVGCPGYFLLGECEGQHQYAKEIFCGKEWCPVCGVKGSEGHNRRIQRWLTKAQQMEHMGYWVFTIPPEIRHRYVTRKSLNDLSKRITCGDTSEHIPGVLKSMGFGRGLSRWHFYGDESPGVYAPHLNVLIEAARLKPAEVAAIKAEWANILGVEFAVSDYGYKKGARKMASCVSYVTRATFTNLDWSPGLAHELFRFHNTKSWGKWNTEKRWNIGTQESRGLKLIEIEGKQVCVCPKCDKPIHWTSAQDMMWLQIQDAAGGAHYLGNGYWELGDLGLMREEHKHDALFRRLLRRDGLVRRESSESP